MFSNKLYSYLKKIAILCIVYFVMFLIIFFSKELSAGIKNGIAVSTNLLIPSLLIFMIFSNIVMNSSLKNIISRPFKLLAKYIFKINNNHMSIVILSLIGGYPIGAKLLSNAVKDKHLSVKNAERMLSYCVNCGPAFIISGVGVSLFGSKKIGLIIYLSQVIACLIVGFLSTLFVDTTDNINIINDNSNDKNFSTLLVNSVNDSIKSLAIICGFVVAFSSFMPLLSLFLKNINPNYRYLIEGILEVTIGCNNLSNIDSANNIILACAFTAFGGVCVHLQVCAMIKGTGIRMYKFFVFRIIYVFISVSIVNIVLKLSPDTLNCISINHNQSSRIYSVSPTATIFLILLSIILLFFCRKSDRIKT